MYKRQKDYRTLGLIFLFLGVGLTITLGSALDPIFLGAGLMFIMIGLAYLARDKAGKASGGDE